LAINSQLRAIYVIGVTFFDAILHLWLVYVALQNKVWFDFGRRFCLFFGDFTLYLLLVLWRCN